MAYAFGDPKNVPKGSTRNLPIVAKQAAILVIDFQKYFSVPGVGGHEGFTREMMPYFFDRVDAAVGNLAPLLDQARAVGTEVIYTYVESLTTDGRDSSLDYKLSGPIHVPKGSTGAEILSGIKPGPDDILIPKTSCSVFNSTNLHYVLGNLGVRQLIVCGQLTDQCIESAVRDAADLGYLVTVLEDGIAAETAEAHARGLRGMQGFSRHLCCSDVSAELRNSSTQQIDLQVGMTSSTSVEQPAQNRSRELGAGQYETLLAASLLAAVTAMTRALSSAGVKFLRICTVDSGSQVRAKALALTGPSADPSGVLNGVGMVECLMGMPLFADMVVPDSGLSPAGVVNLKPDLETLQVIPYTPTHARTFGHLVESDGVVSPLCPRSLLQRAVAEARDMGLEMSVGLEVEFLLSKDGSAVDVSNWAISQALDDQAPFLDELHEMLMKQQVSVEQVHVESAQGQFEVVVAHSNPLAIADHAIICRETISACAKKHGMTATFLPKVYSESAGNGMHLHFSFSKQGCNAFPDASETFGISKLGKAFMAGILSHLPALAAVTTPSVNSFQRLGPGCWAGAFRCWGVENKEAPLRVCQGTSFGVPYHFELKTVDATCNPYLAIALVIASGLDGIRREMSLPAPVGVDPATRTDLEAMPATLAQALDVLEADEILTACLGERLARAYLAVKRSEEKFFTGKDPQQIVSIMMSKGL